MLLIKQRCLYLQHNCVNMIPKDWNTPETKLFIQWYGLAHYQRIINWFTIIEKEKNED